MYVLSKIFLGILEQIEDLNFDRRDLINLLDESFYFSSVEEYDISTTICKRLKIDAIRVQKVVQANVKLSKLFEKFDINNGFINVRLSEDGLHMLCTSANLQSNYLDSLKNSQKTLIIECCGANPTGDMHLGNWRNVFIGYFLKKIYEIYGYKVTLEHYVNDIGTQIDLILSTLEKLKIGEIQLNEVEKYQESIALFTIENKLEEIEKDDLRTKFVSFFVTRQIQEMSNYGIVFDNVYYESNLVTLQNIQATLTLLAKYFEIKSEINGAIGIQLHNKLEILIRGNQKTTYLFDDIIYNLTKKYRKFEKSITLLGFDHELYSKTMYNILKTINVDFNPVLYQFVSINARRMSKRDSLSSTDIDRQKLIKCLRFICTLVTNMTPIQYEHLEKTSQYKIHIINSTREFAIKLDRFVYTLERAIANNDTHIFLSYIRSLLTFNSNEYFKEYGLDRTLIHTVILEFGKMFEE